LSVSAGVVNTLDTDYDVAQYFSIECAVEAPFSPISGEVHSRNLRLIQEASIVVLPNICFGSANLKNLEATELAADKLVIVEETLIGVILRTVLRNEYMGTYDTTAPFSQSSRRS
jgi:iron complex transport system ATP-binding protein